MKPQLPALLTCSRYITVQAGPHPSLTRSLTQDVHFPNKTFCATGLEKDRTNPLWRLSRVFEASTHLDSIHNVLQNPTSEQAFNAEEIRLFVETSNSLRTLLVEEIEDADEIYSGGLGLCNTLVELRSSSSQNMRFDADFAQWPTSSLRERHQSSDH